MCFPPGLILIFAGVLITLLPSTFLQRIIALLSPFIALVFIWTASPENIIQFTWLSETINLLKVTSLGQLFATVFSIMVLVGTIYGLGAGIKKLELAAAFIYAGAAISVCMVGDLLSLFIFWELMALASTYIIFAGGTHAAFAAGQRYLAIHLLGGVLLLIGIGGHWSETGSISFEVMQLDTTYQWLILGAFLINAGAPPLSSWLPDAYPESSPSGMVFLSAFTTKTAVFTILHCFAGQEVLIYFGLFMIFYGIIYALLENDIRRILAYSIVNQVGFMIVGAGIGTTLAINGAAAHAFAHIIYKALLLMSAGAVIHMTGMRKCTEVGGLYRTMPLTAMCGIIGALSISALPLTSGFISKSMIGEAASEGGLIIIWYLLTAASAGVFLHAGIKFPWFVFFQKDSGLRPKEPAWLMRIPMVILAGLCILIGIFPNILYQILPYSVDYKPYTGSHVGTQFQLLLFSGLAFFVFLPQMKRTLTITLDIDWFYRRSVLGLLALTGLTIEKTVLFHESSLRKTWSIILLKVGYHKLNAGRFLDNIPTALAAFWILMILCICLLIYYI